jgi:hypothetical protein
MIRFLFLATLACLLAPAVHAQEIPLEKLTTLASLPPDLTPARSQEAALEEWVFHPTTTLADTEPLTWGWWPPSDGGGTLPGALLSLRPNHGTLDVVLHLRRASAFNQLHRELVRLKAATTPVTCLGCTGERFTAPTYTVSFYQGKPEPYPFIIVLHRSTEPAAGAPLTPANRLSSTHPATPQ